MIKSMTFEEKIQTMNQSRKRITLGSEQDISDVNKMIRQFTQIIKIMKIQKKKKKI